jgi:hypothetical protein
LRRIRPETLSYRRRMEKCNTQIHTNHKQQQKKIVDNYIYVKSHRIPDQLPMAHPGPQPIPCPSRHEFPNPPAVAPCNNASRSRAWSCTRPAGSISAMDGMPVASYMISRAGDTPAAAAVTAAGETATASLRCAAGLVLSATRGLLRIRWTRLMSFYEPLVSMKTAAYLLNFRQGQFLNGILFFHALHFHCNLRFC